jgi:type II secretory pathway pseudopilin PulG
MKPLLRCLGFSRIESLLGLSVMFLVVILILPIMKADLRDEQGRRAEAEARRLAVAILDYNASTGHWPHAHDGKADLSVLDADVLRSSKSFEGNGLLGTLLRRTGTASAAEPGLESSRQEYLLDPWNRPYRVFLVDQGQGGVVVLSAGRNGVLETSPFLLQEIGQAAGHQMGPVHAGDDIGFHLQETHQPGIS